ncbi:molybdate ABC transporter substrate-binding protein [Aquisphaera insulae]|uniref:molybdate ABC transporter substrate-binding protein n=1 Tax=Aquisphaera insulae TaxID=2712864 RepID=UPI0013EC5F64|nr:molybdate ABC transporter substrate-binding protein [Aquisphaera insulae]
MSPPRAGFPVRFPLIALLLLAGCAGGRDGSNDRADRAAKEATPLRIAAASDLQQSLPKLVERFQADSGTTATITLDASGRLAEQIRAGAPYDVFLSANERFVRDLEKGGLIVPESIRPYARGSLVLCVHPSVAPVVKGVKDLEKPQIRKVAIANPEFAPYGVAARQALEKLGLWTTLGPRIVRAESVRQALVYAQHGDAEAALVSRSLIGPDSGVVTIDVDPGIYSPMVQFLGIVSDSSHPDRARAFAELVLGREGQAILKESGFAGPAADTATPAPAAKAEKRP